MTINELYAILQAAVENGFGEQEVKVFPDGFDYPISIEYANIINEDDAEEFEALEDDINNMVIYI